MGGDLLIKYNRYIAHVMEGHVSVCKYVKQAVERQIQDLNRQGDTDFPYIFDEDEAYRVLAFFSLLRFTKGKWAQQKKFFDVEDWQAFILAIMFGWRAADGSRRFQRAYVEVPRKNGKTELGAGIMNFCLLENGGLDVPEVYSAATTKDQARIAFMQAKSMALQLRADKWNWAQKLVGLKHAVLLDSGVMKALSSDDNTLDGLMPSMALIDEYHAHPTSAVLDVIESGMGSRDNPLICIITTAGANITGPCYTQTRKGSENILRGLAKDDRQFCIIYTLDEDDSWEDEATWIKANPNIAVSVSLDFLRAKYTTAKNEGGTKVVEFKTKYLNVWTKQIEEWIPAEVWALGNDAIDETELEGRECYAGLDLSNTLDIAALSFYFPARTENEKAVALFKFWLPEEQRDVRAKNGIPYDVWSDSGYITLTPGNVVDYEMIKSAIIQLSGKYTIRRLELDPWNSLQVEIYLQEQGIPVTRLNQTLKELSAPTKELESQVRSAKLRHGGNPVATWMLSNVMVYRDTNNNIRLHKGKSKEKIDGIAALVNAYAGWMTDTMGKDSGGSYLFDENIEILII